MRATNRLDQFWRADHRPLFDRPLHELRDELDAQDQQPCDRFNAYWAGLVSGLLYGLFAGWLVFGTK